MFGYVKAFKPEMKMAEFDTYKAVYCSLCKTLGKQYGIMAKMTLSYDFTFMALLRYSVANDKICYSKMRCSFNPLVKCNCVKCDNDELQYVAAVSIILFYHKLKDNIADSGFLGKLGSYLLLPFFARYRKKAMAKYKSVDEAAKSMMKSQQTLEADNCDSFDLAAEPTANFLSLAFVREFDSEQDKRVLKQLGTTAGKWIYLADALDDLNSDIKNKNYNCIASRFKLDSNSSENDIKSAKEYAFEVINSYNDGICNAYILLNKRRFDTILGNIIYLGLPFVLNQLKNGKNKSNELPERTEQ